LGSTPKTGKTRSSPELRNALEHHLGEIVNGNLVEHCEIARYGSLISFARQLGLQQAVEPHERILAEEKAADAKRTQIADSALNLRAAQPSRRRKWPSLSIGHNLQAGCEARLQARPRLIKSAVVGVHIPDRVLGGACIPQKQVLRPIGIEVAVRPIKRPLSCTP
jgi:hypothetical protein